MAGFMSVAGSLELISAAIQLMAAGVIVVHIAWASIKLGLREGIDAARAVVADGVVAALGFVLAATLLNVIGLQTWVEIRTFATVLLLRTLLKKVFVKERAMVAMRA